MRIRSLLLPALLAVLRPGAHAQQLQPGMPAPAMSVKAWYKDSPVMDFDAAKIYVVEFWATWCGPCREGIPHITELARKNKDVTFVGISVWEDDKGGNIKRFVDEMGDKMDYHVGYSGNRDGMATSWLAAAKQDGIPCAFIVKEGKIMWVGYPPDMEKPLDEIKAGTFDLEAFKKEFRTGSAIARARRAAYADVDKAANLYKSGKRTEAKSALKKAEAAHPDLAQKCAVLRFAWLALENPKAWDAQARSMSASKKEDALDTLDLFAIDNAVSPALLPQTQRAMSYVLSAVPNDFRRLFDAMNYYQTTKDHKRELAVVDKMIAGFDSSPMKGRAEFKTMLEKQRAVLRKTVK